MAGKGVQLGFLKYVLGFDTLQFKKGISDADADLVKMQKRFAAKGREFQQLGKSLTAFVTLPLAALAGAGIKEAQETAAAMAQVNAALTSMGPVAGRTADQLKRTSDALELKSLYEGDQILSEVTAKLLTFGNISGTVFDQAQQAAVDLATRFGTDLGAAAVLVGKALNDPINGLTALRRIGVSFTDQQREQIKAMAEAGNVAGAQALILKELQREVGGAAEAAQNVDPWNKLSDAFKSIAESIGTLLLPIIPPLANALASVAQWVTSLDPTTQKWVIGIAAATAVLGPLLIVVGNVITAVSAMAPLVLALSKAWTVLQVAFTAARIAAIATLPALTPLLVPLGLLAAAVIGVYEAWKHWDQIKPIVERMVTGVADRIRSNLNPQLEDLKSRVGSVTNKFREMYDKVVGHSYVPDMVEGIAREFSRFGEVMVDPTISATDKVAAAFQSLQSIVGQVLGRKAGGIFAMITDMVSSFGPLLGKLLGGSGSISIGGVESSNASALGLPSDFFGGFRAAGGPVVPGKTYVVGENGPEFLRTGNRGYVSPANDAGPGRITVNQTFAPNFAGNAATMEDLQRMALITKTATMQAIQEKGRRRAR